MDGSNFDSLMEEIFRYKRIMEQLGEENRELHRQIADLREGRGVYIEICGKRFALATEATPAPAQAIPTPAPVSYPTSAPKVSAPGEPTLQQAPTLYNANPDVAEAPTIAMPKTPTLVIEQLDEDEALTPTFLEEIMLDEFEEASTASINQTAVWSPPAKNLSNADEDEKAVLRHQLIGSFLLE